MDVFEITGYQTGVSQAGVNFLQPADSFQNISNGFIYRQVLQSRQGMGYFCPRLAGGTRIYGIFEHTLPDGTKELLAADANYLYKYNAVTGIFDQIPFAGSMAGYAGFNISSNEFYISGTSYPTATNTSRFVFTGEGITPNAVGSSVFFYDGSNVLDFTSTAVTDNPNYSPPTMGALNRATYVLWFGERLNFIVPDINGITYSQGVLYSGIRNTAGNGDKFDVAGSGLFQADTYQNITGASILGQIMVLNFDRMSYVLEKTRDAFNPYFGRAIPGVLGTTAKFSAVSWSDTVESVGRTGVIGTDGRQNLRIDNKISTFTADEIDQEDFILTYGGFDRLNNQFLWAYKESESELDTQDRVLVNNYEEGSWSVYDQRVSVFGQSDVGQSLTWDEIDENANPSWDKWRHTEDIWDKIGINASVQKTLAGDDLGFIYQLNQDYDDYNTGITNITKASQAVLTVDASAFLAGDRVVVEDVEGMTQINNYDSEDESQNLTYDPYIVISATPTSVTLNVDSTLFSTYTASTGRLSKVISFSAETIPFNPYRSIGRRCYISHLEFLIENNGGILKVDAYSDDDESPYILDVICYPDQTQTNSYQWISMTIDNEANFHRFVLKQESPSVQLRITSMRIHAQPGGLTSG